jgi:hypothetical protein
MIADKILKSFYIVEVQGEACGAIITGNFGIDKIAFGSKDFDSDLSAMNGLKKAIKFITSSELLNLDTAKEDVAFNPEFFPSIQPPELTEEQLAEKEETEAAIAELQETLGDSGRQAVMLTRAFDDIGDFVETRWTVEAPSFKIVGRVAVNPDEYMHQKGIDAAMIRNEPMPSKIQTQPVLH